MSAGARMNTGMEEEGVARLVARRDITEQIYDPTSPGF